MTPNLLSPGRYQSPYVAMYDLCGAYSRGEAMLGGCINEARLRDGPSESALSSREWRDDGTRGGAGAKAGGGSHVLGVLRECLWGEWWDTGGTERPLRVTTDRAGGNYHTPSLRPRIQLIYRRPPR